MYQPASPDVAHGYLADYMDGSFFTGTQPPISILGVPFTAIIDMENGELVLKDESMMMPTATILAYTEMLYEE